MFPVYQMSKRGGNMHLTKIKNIQGDIQALRSDLHDLLGVPVGDKGEIMVQNVTGQIIVKVCVKYSISHIYQTLLPPLFYHSFALPDFPLPKILIRFEALADKIQQGHKRVDIAKFFEEQNVGYKQVMETL